MTNSVERTPGGSTPEAFDPPTPQEVAARLLGTDTPTPPEPPPGIRAERPTEPPVVTEPVRTASEPAPPPLPRAEEPKATELTPDKEDKDDTEAKLEKADKRTEIKDKIDGVKKEIEEGRAKGLSTRSLEAYLGILETDLASTTEEPKPVKPERVEPVALETLTPEQVKEEMAASWERLKDLRRKEKPLLHDEMVISGRTGELKYDPDIVATHVDRWREEQWLALLDADGEHVDGVKLSPVEIAAMTTYLKDQRAALDKEDVDERARITEDLALLKKYDKAVLKEWLETGGATWEEMDKLREKGQEWNDFKIEVPVIEQKTKTKPPETPPIIDPPVDPPVEPIPDPPVEPPVEPRPDPIEPVPTPPEITEAQAAYDAAVERWAAARIRSERLLSRGDDKENLAREKENMERAFEVYCSALGQKHVENMRAGQYNIQLSENYVGQSESIQRNLDHQRSLAPADRDPKYREYTDDQFAAEIQEQIDYQESQARYQAQSKAQLEAELASWSQIKPEELMKVRAKVDAEMLRQRTEKHPRLAKMNEWLKKHPKTRMVAGLALTAIGVTGTVTGLAPLALIGFGGRTALGAYGAYNASRGIGEMVGARSEKFGLGSQKFKESGDPTRDKIRKENIGEELTAQEKQTTTRKWSKRVGAAAAGIVGLIGAYKIANAIDGPPPRPDADQRYGSINNGELNARLANGDFVSGAERTEAIARLKGVIGEDLYNQLGEQQREALLLLKNPQIDQAPAYFQHLAAGHFG